MADLTSVDAIVQAMQDFIAAVTPSDGSEPQLTDDQAARYADLEAQLHTAQKSRDIMARHALLGHIAPQVSSGLATARIEDPMDRSFNAFLRGKGVDDLMARAQSEGSGPAGGFLVPDLFQQKMVERRKAFGGLAAAAETVTTETGAPLPWLTNDDVSATEAGIVPENAQNTFGADFIFGKNALSAYKYDTAGASGDWLKVPWELLQDSAYDLQGFIARKFAERIARKEAVDFINGQGSGEPVGLISTMGGIPSSGITLASAVAPTYVELNSIIHSLDPAYRDGASWIMNDTSYAALQAVSDTQGRPLFWNQNGSLADGTGLQLLGYPIIIDQAMPSLTGSSVKWTVFGNIRDTYVVRRVKGFTLQIANELFARNGQVGYLGWERADGMVQDPNAAVYSTSHA